MSSMTRRKRRAAQSTVDSKEFIHIRIPTPELRNRFKRDAASEGLSYHEFLTLLLDERDAKLRRRIAQMASPLHRPPENLDPTVVPL